MHTTHLQNIACREVLSKQTINRDEYIAHRRRMTTVISRYKQFCYLPAYFEHHRSNVQSSSGSSELAHVSRLAPGAVGPAGTSFVY